MSVEKFIVNDGRSIRRLSKNQPGEENSARSYHRLTVRLLQEADGVLEQKRLEAAVLRNFAPSFGPDDYKPIGKWKLPKWKNSLAWAKVLGRQSQVGENGELLPQFLQRRGRGPGGGSPRGTYIVLIEPKITPLDWIAWVRERPAARFRGRKRCPNCRRKHYLSAKKCKCGYVWPRSIRKHKLPK